MASRDQVNKKTCQMRKMCLFPFKKETRGINGAHNNMKVYWRLSVTCVAGRVEVKLVNKEELRLSEIH